MAERESGVFSLANMERPYQVLAFGLEEVTATLNGVISKPSVVHHACWMRTGSFEQSRPPTISQRSWRNGEACRAQTYAELLGDTSRNWFQRWRSAVLHRANCS